VAEIIDFEEFRRSLRASNAADWFQELGFTQLIPGEPHHASHSEARNAFACMIWDDIPLM
jgi:hypothetical protein